MLITCRDNVTEVSDREISVMWERDQRGVERSV